MQYVSRKELSSNERMGSIQADGNRRVAKKVVI